MTKTIYISLLMLVTVMSVTHASIWEMQGAYEAFFPTDELWKGQAHGGEARLIHWWPRNRLGLALSAGHSQWTVKDQAIHQTAARTLSTRGKANYTPLGISFLSQQDLGDHPSIQTTLEAGVRYMLCDSRVTLTEILDLGGGPPDVETYDMDFENGIIGRLAAGLEVKLSGRAHPPRVFTNIAYQFDLSKGKAQETQWTNYTRKIGLAGMTLQLGFALPLQ